MFARAADKEPDDLHLSRPQGPKIPHRAAEIRTPLALKPARADHHAEGHSRTKSSPCSVIATPFNAAQEIKS